MAPARGAPLWRVPPLRSQAETTRSDRRQAIAWPAAQKPSVPSGRSSLAKRHEHSAGSSPGIGTASNPGYFRRRQRSGAPHRAPAPPRHAGTPAGTARADPLSTPVGHGLLLYEVSVQRGDPLPGLLGSLPLGVDRSRGSRSCATRSTRRQIDRAEPLSFRCSSKPRRDYEEFWCAGNRLLALRKTWKEGLHRLLSAR